MKKTLVAIYLRCSSDLQDLSIERQRKEVIAYCKDHGYEIAATFIDEGKSGSKDIHKRIEFHRMLAAAPTAKWERVICYNTSRFGRLDSIKGAPYKEVLRNAGKCLETIKDGLIDWQTFSGRIVDTVRSELDHQYSVGIAGATTSGRNNILDLGFWPFGTIPYGYDRLYFYEGKEVGRVPRTAKTEGVKARGWRLKLIPNDEAATVKWLFDMFVSGKCRGMRKLARMLNEQGVPSPGGKVWGKDSIKAVLTHRAYIGQAAPGHHRSTKTSFEKMKKTIKDGMAPVLIDPAQWHKAQALVEKQSKVRPAREYHRQSALSGILYCGHCGYSMEKRARKYKDGQAYVTYACSTANKRPGCSCKQWTIQEKKILPFICAKLIEAVDAELLSALKAKPHHKPEGDIQGLKQQAETLRKQIEKGVKRLTLVDDDLLPDLQEQLKALRAELAATEERIAKGAGSKQGFQDWWQQAKGQLVCITPTIFEGDLPGALQALARGDSQPLKDCMVSPGVYSEPLDLRNLLHDLGCKVSLFWKQKGRYAELDRARLQAEFGEQGLASGDATPSQTLLLKIDRVYRANSAA